MSFGSGALAELWDFASLTVAIREEAARRALPGVGANLPSSPANSEGWPGFVLGSPPTANLYNNFVGAINALNTEGTFQAVPELPAGTIFRWQHWQLLVDRISALRTEVMICLLPSSFDALIANRVRIVGTVTGGRSNRVANVTEFWSNIDYCGVGMRQSSVTGQQLSYITNNEGFQAEQLHVTTDYRRGCGCGSDAQLYWSITLVALSNGWYYGSYGLSINQWGC